MLEYIVMPKYSLIDTNQELQWLQLINLLRWLIAGFYNHSLYIQIIVLWEKKKDMLKRKYETAFDTMYLFIIA